MPDSDLIFSKIVALPNPSSWSQVYSAGKLFAVLSLKRDAVPGDLLDSLNVVGRGVLDRLEEEFFTIETKDLLSIKQALAVTLQKIPEEIASSFAAAVFIDNVLYLFGKSGSKTFIKRGGKFGTILDSIDENPKSIVSCSGPLEDGDLIILATKPFLDVVGPSLLFSSLDNLPPNEIAESLAPKVHEKDDGGSAVFIIKYIKGIPEQSSYLEETKEDAQHTRNYTSFLKKYLPIQFSRSKKLFLTVAVAILIILVSSIFFAVKKQNDTKSKTLFEEIYVKALKKYDEGNSLLDLNKSLAIDSLTISKQLLSDNKNKFSYNSKEQNEILALLEKVDKALELGSAANQVKAKEATADTSVFLKAQINPPAGGPKVNLFAQDDNKVYFLDNSGIFSIDKKTNKKKVIIKNDGHWKNPIGVASYLGNIYVLDKDANQILKFVEAKDGFTKTNYFTNEISNLSNVQAMTIDGSIWILFKDGSIQKFTKGKKDTFTISGLKEPFSNPTKIFTDADISNLYILDNGNSRIVVLGKDGNYQMQYKTDILKGAKDFEVKETDKKIFILSQNKIYEIETR